MQNQEGTPIRAKGPGEAACASWQRLRSTAHAAYRHCPMSLVSVSAMLVVNSITHQWNMQSSNQVCVACKSGMSCCLDFNLAPGQAGMQLMRLNVF